MSLTTTTANPQVEADHWLFVGCQWGTVDPQFQGYCSSSEERVLLDRRYSPAPALEVSYGKASGVLREQPTSFSLPMDGFLDALSGPDPHAPVAVTILELRKDGGENDIKTRFVGSARKAYRNANGKRGIVRVECVSFKALLEASVAPTTDVQCANTFGGPGCFIDTAALTEDAFVDDVSGVVATLSGLTPITNPSLGKYWHRGYLDLNGLRIGIRDWDQSNPGRFVLNRPAPASWKGLTVKATPGCDLFEMTCGGRWGNLPRFNGRGKAMPNYNPTIEDAPA